MHRTKSPLIMVAVLALFSTNAANAQTGDQSKCPKISKHINPDKIILQSGRVDLPEFNTYIDVPNNLRFIGTEEAKSFLHFELQKSACEVQPFVGLFVSPKNWQNFGQVGFKDNWLIDITYDPSFVSDEDAISTNYQEMIQQVRESLYDRERASYSWGGSTSYTHVMGWALPPEYDPRDNTAIWSLHILHGDSPDYTVPIRAIKLGAKSNFRLNTRGSFSRNSENREFIKKAISSINFYDGWKYSDVKSASFMNRSKTIGTVISESIFVQRAAPLTWKEYIYAIFYSLLKIIYHYFVQIIAFATIFGAIFVFRKIKRTMFATYQQERAFPDESVDQQQTDRPFESQYASANQTSTRETKKTNSIRLNGIPFNTGGKL